MFARPGDFFSASWDAVWGAYTALFRGSIYNTRVEDFQTAIRPLTETLKFAAPLIVAGLGVGLAFRAALFNIGGRGQMLMAGAAAGWVGYQFEMPWPIHVTLAILAGMAAGALWGGLVGLLKARTGAHEVIVTIMLNYVAFYLVFYALSEQNLLQAPGSANPKSLPMKDSAILPKLLGDRYNLHLGLPPGADRRRRRLVDPQPVLPRLPDPSRRREPRRGPQRRHRRRSHLHRRDAHLRWRSSVWRASTRCSAP